MKYLRKIEKKQVDDELWPEASEKNIHTNTTQVLIKILATVFLVVKTGLFACLIQWIHWYNLKNKHL